MYPQHRRQFIPYGAIKSVGIVMRMACFLVHSFIITVTYRFSYQNSINRRRKGRKEGSFFGESLPSMENGLFSQERHPIRRMIFLCVLSVLSDVSGRSSKSEDRSGR
jgi:hypothetical protein